MAIETLVLAEHQASAALLRSVRLDAFVRLYYFNNPPDLALVSISRKSVLEMNRSGRKGTSLSK